VSELARVDLLVALEREGKATAVSLDLDDPEMPWATFAALATMLGGLRDATAWWIADLLVYGDAVYGFPASQAETFLKREPETLRRWQWVAEKVPKSRRDVRLSFSHHETVAALDDPDEQRELLDLAVAKRLSVSDFRAVVKRRRSAIEQRSTANKLRAPESENPADPDLDPGESTSGHERRAESGADAVCPTCGQPVPERLPIVEQGRRPEWA
jgi:hypothetical protein